MGGTRISHTIDNITSIKISMYVVAAVRALECPVCDAVILRLQRKQTATVDLTS